MQKTAVQQLMARAKISYVLLKIARVPLKIPSHGLVKLIGSSKISFRIGMITVCKD